jgi:asparagine synthase (glutamine-hydrolysing)
MVESVRHLSNHIVEEYEDEFIHVGRAHLGVYNRGKQPVFSPDGAAAIVAEGMVYPWGDDGEHPSGWIGKLLESYAQKGDEAFAQLNGSFSAVVFDRVGRKVSIVSDRFGTRPIYYWVQGGDFAFASEAKAILKHPLFIKKLNRVAISKFFRYGKLSVFGDDTWFQGVFSLPPATVLTFDGERTRQSRYWDLSYSPDRGTSADAHAKRLAALLRDAMELRTSNPGLRYSVALSGGLDSRAVLAAAGRRRSVGAYTFGIRGSHELAIASKVARAAGAEHLVCTFDQETTARYAEQVVWLSDGFDVLGITFLLLADERLAGRFDVSIDGFALDLTLGGSFLRKKIVEAKDAGSLEKILHGRFAVFSEAEMNRLFTRPLLDQMGDSAERSFHEIVSQARGDSIADRADYFALRTRVRNFTIMGHVLSRNYFEDAFPTLDNGFIDALTKVPAELRFQYVVYRKFLKTLDAKLSGIQYELTGMSPNRPYLMWELGRAFDKAIRTFNFMLLKGTRGRASRPYLNSYVDVSGALRTSRSWKDLVSKTLANRNSLMYTYGIINREFVLGLVRQHSAGTRDNREKITYLMNFELLLRLFFAEGID